MVDYRGKNVEVVSRLLKLIQEVKVMLCKRPVSLLVLISLVISIFCGCSTGNSNKSTTQQSVSTNSNTTVAKETVPKEIVKVYFYGGVAGSKKETYDAVRQYIIDNAGIEPVPIIPPSGSYQEKLNILLASDEPLDLFQGAWTDYYQKGLIQPLNDLLTNDGQDIKILWSGKLDITWNAMTDREGKIWSIPGLCDLAAYSLWIRSDWVKKVGFEMPKTIDDLEGILKAFKEKDPSGTGETIPLASDFTSLKNGFAAGFIQDYGIGNWMDTDGKVKPMELNPGYKDFVAKMADWYKKGYIFKESFVSKADTLKDLVKQNKIGATPWFSIISKPLPQLQKTVTDANYEVPKDLKGPKGYMQTPYLAGPNGTLLSKKSKNPEAAIKLVNWLSNMDNYLVSYAGIQDVNWKYSDKSTRTVTQLNKDYTGEFLVYDSFAHTVQYQFDDKDSSFEFFGLRTYFTNFDNVKRPFDSNIIYDNKVLGEKIPMLADINRMRDEETIKFITGVRPMSQYEDFINELYKAGLDTWITEYTKMYNDLKK
jgi:ABC-type sugar transport system, periplasmic component